MKLKIFNLSSLVLVFSLLSWQVTFAQDSISMENYVKSVLEYHPQLKAEKSQLEATALDQEIAKMREDPTLEMQYAHNRESSLFHGPGVEGGISIPIDWWNQRKSRIKVAHAAYEQAHLDFQMSEAELKQLARQVYIETWIHQEMEQVISAYYASIVDLFERDSIQYTLGAIAEIDFKQTKIEKEKVSFELLNHQKAKQDLEIIFATLLGIEVRQLKPYVINYQQINDLPQWENLMEHLWALRQKDWEIKEAQEEFTLIKKERKVSPEIIAEVEHHFLKDPGTLNQHTENKWTVGIGIPLPFTNRNKAPLRQQNILIEQAHWEKEQLALTLKQEWMSTINAYQTAQQRVFTFENSILKDADDWLEQIEFAYRSGNVNWLNYVYAQNNWRDLQLEYYDNLMIFWEAMIQLQYWIEQVEDE